LRKVDREVFERVMVSWLDRDGGKNWYVLGCDGALYNTT
jgi:hypothetical protein